MTPLPRPAATGEAHDAGRMDARAWLVALAFWFALGLVESASGWMRSHGRANEVTWLQALWANLPWWLLWAPLTPPALALARRAPLLGDRWPRGVVVHALASLAFTLVHLTVEAVVFYWSVSRGRTPSLGAQWRVFVDNYLVLDVVTYWVIVGAAHALEAHRRWRDAAVQAAEASARAARLELGLSEARLQALRMELNPHFLFNALNAVSGLVRRDERDAAVRMLARLGELLRATLGGDVASEHALDDELALLERYVDIERARFGDRLTVTVGADGEARRALVPTLLLQPLVENAIRHGVGRRPGAARVAVSAWREGGRLHVVVEDDGAGIRGVPREGIGLTNTRARLAARWSDAAMLALEPVVGGGARLALSFPYARAADSRREVVNA